MVFYLKYMEKPVADLRKRNYHGSLIAFNRHKN